MGINRIAAPSGPSTRKLGRMKNRLAIEIISTLFTALIISTLIILHTSRPPELMLVFDSFFYWAVASLLLSVIIIGVLIWRRKVHTANVQLFFGLLLVALGAVIYGTWEQVQQNAEFWAAHIHEHSGTLSIAIVSIALAKNLVSFGIAAIGASIAAAIITRESVT